MTLFIPPHKAKLPDRPCGRFSFWDRFFSSYILLTFISQVIFPPQVFAQVMAGIPTAVIPQVVPAYAPVMSDIPLVIPSVLEKEKFVNVGKFSFSRTDYVSLSRPSEQLDGRVSSSDYLNEITRTPRPRPVMSGVGPPVWDGIIGGSFEDQGISAYLRSLGFVKRIILPVEAPASPQKAGLAARKRLTLAFAVAPQVQAVFDTTKSFYDKLGNRTQGIDANGNDTDYAYGLVGRLKTVIQNDGVRDIPTSYTYDTAGNIKTVTDAEGRTTTILWSPRLIGDQSISDRSNRKIKNS